MAYRDGAYWPGRILPLDAIPMRSDFNTVTDTKVGTVSWQKTGVETKQGNNSARWSDDLELQKTRHLVCHRPDPPNLGKLPRGVY